MARLRLLELYDDTYGIVNHDSDPSPFSLVSQVEMEDALVVSGYGGYMDEYLKANIYNHFGIDFPSWMKYTYSKQKLLVEKSVRHGVAQNDVKSGQLDALTARLLADNTKGG